MASLLIKHKHAANAGFFIAPGRWASCLLPGCFGRYQNLLRMILIDFASLVTAPKKARPQALFRFSFITCKLRK